MLFIDVLVVSAVFVAGVCFGIWIAPPRALPTDEKPAEVKAKRQPRKRKAKA